MIKKKRGTTMSDKKDFTPVPVKRYPPNATPADDNNSHKYLQNSLEISRLPKIDTNNAEQVRERVFEYFSICERNDVKASVAGLALAFGVSRMGFWKWINGAISKPKEVLEELQMAYNILNVQMEDYMLNGKINPVAGIFLMKNNMGYKDEQTYNVAPVVHNDDEDQVKLIEESSHLIEED